MAFPESGTAVLGRIKRYTAVTEFSFILYVLICAQNKRISQNTKRKQFFLYLSTATSPEKTMGSVKL